MIEINNKKLCESCFSETEEAVCPFCGFSKEEYNEDQMVLPMGSKLNDKIIIGRVMGKGGFGVTYLGFDERMEKTIAVKEYFPNGIAYRSQSGTEVLIADAKSEEAFEKGAEKFYTEAQMVAQFNGNPNIVSVYDYFRANNTVYLIMEYLNGVTLKNYIKNHGKLSDGQTLFIMDKMAAALSITHSAGVLHRDISPDNIMICMDGKIKLIDFGAARQIMAESSSNLTVVLKPGYTPIEQYTKKGRQGAWTDIYSLGVSVYYALTGTVIDDPYERMESDDEFSENKHGINSALWNILKKCTMINASDRYGSAIDLRKALSSVSAPLKAEPIVLAAEDMKEKPEQKTPSMEKQDGSADSTAPVTDAPEDKRAENKNPETIAVFETENGGKVREESNSGDVPNLKMEDDPGLDLSVNVYESGGKKGSKKSSGRKRAITALIFAVAAIAVVALVVSLSIRGNKTDTDLPGHYLLIDKNDLLWSMQKHISSETLREFEGDILVTLNVSPIETFKNEDGSYYHVITVRDNNNNIVDIDAYNAESIKDSDVYSDGYYNISEDQQQFTFILRSTAITDTGGYISFDNQGVTVNSAELRSYRSSGTVKKSISFPDTYPGNWQLYQETITKKDLESFGRDVMVTLYIETRSYDNDDPWWHIELIKDAENWIKPDITAFNTSPKATDDMYSLYFEQDKFVFIISKEEIEALTDDGLKIQVHNAVVKSAALEGCSIGEVDVAAAEAARSDTTAGTLKASADDGSTDHLLIDDNDPLWSMEKKISADTLKKFKGDIFVALNIKPMDIYAVEENGEIVYWHNVSFHNNGKTVNVKAYNRIYDEEWDNYNVDEGQEKFIFLLRSDTAEKLDGSLDLDSYNLAINSAELWAYDSSDAKTIRFDSGYPGDFQAQDEAVPKNDLESFGGDVMVTLDIETDVLGTPEEWEWWWHIDTVKENTDGWLERVKITAFNQVLYDPSYMYTIYEGQEQFVFVISRNEIEALPEDGLKIQVHNLIVRSATLEAYNFTA